MSENGEQDDATHDRCCPAYGSGWPVDYCDVCPAYARVRLDALSDAVETVKAFTAALVDDQDKAVGEQAVAALQKLLQAHRTPRGG